MLCLSIAQPEKLNLFKAQIFSRFIPHPYQQLVIAIVPQLDIGKTLQITFAQLAMLLALRVQTQATLNVPLAIQGIFCSSRLHQQLVSILVQMDMLETLQLGLVCSAIFLVQFVRVLSTLNALPAT